MDKEAPDHERASHLAASLLIPSEPPRAGKKEYPSVPDEEDLIGFVTTGNFNLGEGRATGIGNIALSRVLPVQTPETFVAGPVGKGGHGKDGMNGPDIAVEHDGKDGEGKTAGSAGKNESKEGEGWKGVLSSLVREDKLCIIREAGEGLGRLARWEFV